MRFRSLLYVPADNPRFVAKAHERGADAVILDLEDAVTPANKLAARAALAEAVPAASRNGARIFVRINAEPELAADDAEAACRAGAFGLYVPKARSAAGFVPIEERVSRAEAEIGRPPMRFVALVEDAAGLLEARAIAKLPRVMALSLGGEDFALATGAEPTPEVLHVPKLLVHYATRAEGKLSFGLLRSVAGYADLDGLREAARQAKRFGFDGATCVHPSGVAILNEGFLPSPEQRAWAERILAAMEMAEHGAVAVDGQMVDAPVLARARAILGDLGER